VKRVRRKTFLVKDMTTKGSLKREEVGQLVTWYFILMESYKGKGARKNGEETEGGARKPGNYEGRWCRGKRRAKSILLADIGLIRRQGRVRGRLALCMSMMQPTHRHRSWQRPGPGSGIMDQNPKYELVANCEDDSVETAAAEIEGSTNADPPLSYLPTQIQTR